MSRFTRLTSLLLALGGASSALGACQSLAGIEDRTYSSAEAGAAGPDKEAPPSTKCVEYCNKTKDVCPASQDGSALSAGLLYLTSEACLATCAQIPLLGDNQNSVACRTQQLALAKDTGADGLDQYCANAGPGGNGKCGSNCENYCRLFAVACKDEFQKYAANAGEGDDGTAVCVSKCLGLTDTGLFDATPSGNYTGDTLQCRLIHTSSSLLDPTGHCSHAELKSAAKCVDDPKAVPDCKKFCHLEMTECADAGYPMYESDAQCQAVCNALPPGHIADVAENTVGCRMYHSYNALLDPGGHCAHTGPGGDGHCGPTDPKGGYTGNCESYCLLLTRACKPDFDARFASQSECQTECAKLDGADPESGYSTAATGNNLQCRLLHVSRALTNGKECGAALGAAPCK